MEFLGQGNRPAFYEPRPGLQGFAAYVAEYQRGKAAMNPAPDKIVLTVPRLAPSFNEMLRLFKDIKAFKDLQEVWNLEILAARGRDRRRFTRATIIIERFYCSNPLDLDGLYAAGKIPIDAIRRAGIMPDDNPRVLVGLHCTQIKVATRKAQKTVIEIYNREGTQDDKRHSELDKRQVERLARREKAIYPGHDLDGDNSRPISKRPVFYPGTGGTRHPAQPERETPARADRPAGIEEETPEDGHREPADK